MLNQSGIERGLFCLTSYKTITDIERTLDTYSQETIMLPPKNSQPGIREGTAEYFRRKDGANYSLLGEDGVVTPNKYVKEGDIIIGKVAICSDKNSNETRVDISRQIHAGEEGMVDRVYKMVTPDGYMLVKVVVRQVRTPGLGDKLASRAAQKGTIGMVYRQEDMPFTSSGVVPEIIINPLCMPSRMTTNQLIECALGKECTISGEYADATPFTENSVNVAEKLVTKMTKELGKYGFSPHGWETMYNGMTGERIKSRIFIGPTYYQRLKHMVQDKMHARARGCVTMLTRQPREGRARDGGLRCGEMERDCLISQGMSKVLYERLFDVSDPFYVPVCDICHIIASSKTGCQKCKGDRITICPLPYAAKLLTQELNVMGLKTEFFPKK